MDKYEVLGLLGEGSFGRVYKAKLTNDSTTVALKVISKRGRSVKEIKGLRRECEIQRHLHHPNIIQMLDSFETDNEIVVITEFAHKELTAILSKEGYLSEERVQAIVWDLVSALYYLHSHRVLHRDLKPQNILLDSRNKAKLCDFGFARNMSTGTHVLTSIKGTPLYMAPELIEEHPYDHSADLWSLGCIIYELLVGAPPFCTTSILHLIRMIRHEQIQFPTFLSDNCISFLKGLLQKDPTKRLSWPDILKHPFMKGHILILDDVPSKPLTRPLSIDTLEAKEQQRKNCLTQKTHPTKLPSSKSSEATNSRVVNTNKQTNVPKSSEACADSNTILEQCSKSHEDEENCNIDAKFAVLALECCESTNKKSSDESRELSDSQNNVIKNVADVNKNSINSETSAEAAASNIKDVIKIEDKIIINEDSSPIENEEWIVFLQRTIEEVMNGEMTSLCQPSLANICVSPLHNLNASPKVLNYVASLFSLPFVVHDVSAEVLKQILKVYVNLKLIPNLVCASKLIFKYKRRDLEENSSSDKYSLSMQDVQDQYISISDLQDEDLQALERIYQLICHLVHLDDKFLNQFCDVVVILNMYNVLRKLLLLVRRKTRIVIDLIAILTHILRRFPDKVDLICEVVLNLKNDSREGEIVNFTQLLRHSNSLLRERVCYFLQFLGKISNKTLESIWSDVIKDTLEALIYDSMENVRNAAEVTVEELKKLSFYEVKVNNSTNSKELCLSIT